jgi:hypothetical protein
MFEDLNVWMFECLCPLIAGLRKTRASLNLKIELGTRALDSNAIQNMNHSLPDRSLEIKILGAHRI